MEIWNFLNNLVERRQEYSLFTVRQGFIEINVLFISGYKYFYQGQ